MEPQVSPLDGVTEVVVEYSVHATLGAAPLAE